MNTGIQLKLASLSKSIANAIVAIENNEPTERMVESMRSGETSRGDFIKCFQLTGGWIGESAQMEYIRELKAFQKRL